MGVSLKVRTTPEVSAKLLMTWFVLVIVKDYRVSSPGKLPGKKVCLESDIVRELSLHLRNKGVLYDDRAVDRYPNQRYKHTNSTIKLQRQISTLKQSGRSIDFVI
jgi:hypothetical protein